MARKKNGNSNYQQEGATISQSVLPLALQSDDHLTISELETWLWDAACVIRGATDAPKYKDFILPLIFYKRLSDVFDDEFQEHVKRFDNDEGLAYQVIMHDYQDALVSGRQQLIVRFLIPDKYRWFRLRNHPADSHLGEFVTDAMRAVAERNPKLQGVLDVKDYNERQSDQRTLDEDRLAALIEVISRHRLGLHNTEPDVLGRAYEYLLRKFAEGQGQSAGEFYTPKEVGWLIASLINPQPLSTIYDPASGSGGLLIKARLYYEQHNEEKSKAPQLFGQELNPVTFAMAKMNMFLHDYTDAHFTIGDTFIKPGFSSKDRGLQKFDYVVANPMWNQDQEEAFYEHDPWERFQHFGIPPRSSADWGWIQHIYASLKAQGRAAVVLDTGAVSRGSGSKSSNRERDIRQRFVEEDLIECVILLPENLFYNTTAPGVIIMLNRNKPAERKNQLLLINAANYFVKRKPKNELTSEGIDAITQAYRQWETREKLSRVITFEEARNADYNLSPSQFVDVNDKVVHRQLREIMRDLDTVRIERQKADEDLIKVLSKLDLSEKDNA